MLIEYDFAVTQLRYLREALILIPSFRPDGQTPTTLGTLITSSNTVRSAYITTMTALDGARADRRVAVDALHDACVDFSAQAAVTFRTNKAVRERLDRLPIKDQSFQETLTRADAVLALWDTLPQVGSPAADFAVMQGTATLDLAAMQALRDAAADAHEGIPTMDQAFQEDEAELHEKQREMEGVVSAALALGKSQFDEGTPEREVIDAIPADSPATPPGKAVISESSSSGPGVAHLTYDAGGATSFDVYERAEGAPTFNQVAEDRLDKTLELNGLSPGNHEFYVRGRNARGLGEESDLATVDVQA